MDENSGKVFIGFLVIATLYYTVQGVIAFWRWQRSYHAPSANPPQAAKTALGARLQAEEWSDATVERNAAPSGS